MVVKATKKSLNVGTLVSGTLFNFSAVFGGPKNISRFTDQMVTHGTATGEMGKMLYSFVGTGSKAGLGKMNRAMAQSAVSWIKSVLRGYTQELGAAKITINREDRYKGPAIIMKRGDTYQTWIDETAFFKEKYITSFLTGRMAASIIATQVSGGGYAIGVDRRRYVKNPIPFSKPLKFRKKKIKVGDYAMWQEKGFQGFPGYPPRPWIIGAMVGFVTETDRRWGALLESFLYGTYFEASGDYGGTDAGAPKMESMNIEEPSGKVKIRSSVEKAARAMKQGANAMDDVVNFLKQVKGKAAGAKITGKRLRLLTIQVQAKFGDILTSGEMNGVLTALETGIMNTLEAD